MQTCRDLIRGYEKNILEWKGHKIFITNDFKYLWCSPIDGDNIIKYIPINVPVCLAAALLGIDYADM